MGVDKFNHEGYFDPTTYEALTALVNKNWTRIFDFFTALTSFQTVNI